MEESKIVPSQTFHIVSSGSQGTTNVATVPIFPDLGQQTNKIYQVREPQIEEIVEPVVGAAQQALSNASTLLSQTAGSVVSSSAVPASAASAVDPVSASALRQPPYNVFNRSPPRSPSTVVPRAVHQIRAVPRPAGAPRTPHLNKSKGREEDSELTEDKIFARQDALKSMHRFSNKSKVSFSDKNMYQEYSAKNDPFRTGRGRGNEEDDEDDAYEDEDEDGYGEEEEEEEELEDEEDDGYGEEDDELGRRDGGGSAMGDPAGPGRFSGHPGLGSSLPGLKSSLGPLNSQLQPQQPQLQPQQQPEKKGLWNSFKSFFSSGSNSSSSSSSSTSSNNVASDGNNTGSNGGQQKGILASLFGSKKPNPFGFSDENYLRSVLKGRIRRWYESRNIEYKDEEINNLSTEVLKQRVCDAEYDRSIEFYMVQFRQMTMLAVMFVEWVGTSVEPRAKGYTIRHMTQHAKNYESLYYDLYDDTFATRYISPATKLCWAVMQGFFAHVMMQIAYEEGKKRQQHPSGAAPAADGAGQAAATGSVLRDLPDEEEDDNEEEDGGGGSSSSGSAEEHKQQQQQQQQYPFPRGPTAEESANAADASAVNPGFFGRPSSSSTAPATGYWGDASAASVPLTAQNTISGDQTPPAQYNKSFFGATDTKTPKRVY